MDTAAWLALPPALPLPPEENALSRRYRKIVEGWVPTAMRHFHKWPGRPKCGHFFGGVHWYGLETAFSAFALAAAASSPEYDAAKAGFSVEQLKSAAAMGLRYLCFTHDSGPEDCVRPAEGLGRPENLATKWGERGKGFFKESQCASSIAPMVKAAMLLGDEVDEETWAMLARVAADYMARFEDMPPRSGVYADTQTEENAWTAKGLACGALLLGNHPRAAAWMDHAKRWMFCVTTRPEDRRNAAPFGEGETVGALTGKTFTTLPDGLAENHGFVHPSYMGSAVAGLGATAMLFRLYGMEPPPHLLWRRQNSYDILKRMSDGAGAPHAVQGMDWEYSPCGSVFLHACANLWLRDPDAALLERRSLEQAEALLRRQQGRFVREDVARHCHGVQDPAIMQELKVSSFAEALLAHRLMGEGVAPSDAEDFERRHLGVRHYPHGGALFHRHPKGQTSFAWRNRTMVLPLTPEGMSLVCPASESVLAQVRVKDRPPSDANVSLVVREEAGRAIVVLLQELAQRSVRRQVLFATLPGGDCLVAERLVAREAATVEKVDQGFFRIRNDGMGQGGQNSPARRTLHWPGGSREFEGAVTGRPEDDEILRLAGPGWVNVDDRLGLVFRGDGETLYHNRRHYDVWRAVADDLFLNSRREERAFHPGEHVAEMFLRVCPGQKRGETAQTPLWAAQAGEGVVLMATEGALAAANFGEGRFEGAVALDKADWPVPVFPGVNEFGKGEAAYRLSLGPGEGVLKAAAGVLVELAPSDARLVIEVGESGAWHAANAGLERTDAIALIRGQEQSFSLAPGERAFL